MTKSRPATKMVAGAVVESESGQLILGQLTVRRVPRVDIDVMMLEGVKEMDVIWHSAAEAAEALRYRPDGWKVIHVLKRATKKFFAKKATQQQLASVGDDVAEPVDQAVISLNESCGADLLKHLLSSALRQGVDNTTYECRFVLTGAGAPPYFHRVS